MSLAQVVYNISTDSDFAALWRRDPEAALAGKGFKLSREELEFLSAGLRRGGHEEGRSIRLSDLAVKARDWR
jgi:hypothetical protein